MLDLTTLELSRVTELMIPLEDSVRPSGKNVPLNKSKSKTDIYLNPYNFPFIRRFFSIFRVKFLINFFLNTKNPTQVCIKLNATLWPRTQEDKELVNFPFYIFFSDLDFAHVLIKSKEKKNDNIHRPNNVNERTLYQRHTKITINLNL